jgi:type III pantothenate kinase
MQQSLATGTANLNPIEADYPAGLADNTDAAIYNGVLYAACGIIEHALARQSAGLDLILTGGNAELIANNLLMPALIEPELVLKGLALTAPAIL